MTSSLMFFHDVLDCSPRQNQKKRNQKRVDRSRVKQKHRSERGMSGQVGFFSFLSNITPSFARHPPYISFKKMNFSIPSSLINDFSTEKADAFFENTPSSHSWRGWDEHILDAASFIMAQKNPSPSQIDALKYLVKRKESKMSLLANTRQMNFEVFRVLVPTLSTSERASILFRLTANTRESPEDVVRKIDFMLKNDLVSPSRIAAQKSYILWQVFEYRDEKAKHAMLELLSGFCSWNDAVRTAIVHEKSSSDIDLFLCMPNVAEKDLKDILDFAAYKKISTPNATARYQKWVLGNAVTNFSTAAPKESKKERKL